MVIRSQVSVDTTRGYSQCFGCGQDNPFGLKLEFEWDGETARAEFAPSKHYQGWKGIVHGGIITCILDEAMGYAVLFEGVHCITAKMHARLKRPALIDELLIITSAVTRKNRRLVEARANISLRDGTPIAEGDATMFILDPRTKGNKKVEPEANG